MLPEGSLWSMGVRFGRLLSAEEASILEKAEGI